MKFTLGLLLLLSSTPLFAQEDTRTNEPLHPKQAFLPLIVDLDLNMRGGAENIVTLQRGLTWAEDRFIGSRWFSEDNVLGKAGGITGRAVKLALFDLPQDYFSVVFAHEYFGHGARGRELDVNYIHYTFDLPPPFDKGGGTATAYGTIGSTHQILSYWIGGIEIHPLINRNLALRWMKTKEFRFREASLYFWSWQIMFTYVQDAEKNLADGEHDSDPRAYVRVLNSLNGYNDLNNLPMSVGDMQSKMAYNIANPFVFYSLYGILKSYLWDGDVSTPLPAIKIGQVEYLPNVRVGFTPFGLEYHLENYLSTGELTSLVDLSIGDQTYHPSWGGIGITVQNLFSSGQLSADAMLNLWKQPELEFGKTTLVKKGGGVGGAFSVRGHYDFFDSNNSLAAVVELGYKSVGFLEGYALDASPIFLIGIDFRH